MRYSTPTPSAACTSTTVAVAEIVVVERHLLVRRGRSLCHVSVVPVGAPLDLRPDVQCTVENPVEVIDDVGPVHLTIERPLRDELLEAGAVGVTVHRRGDDRDAVHREHPRDAAEDAGLVVDNHRQQVAIRLDSACTGLEERDLLGRRLVGGHIGDRAAAQARGRRESPGRRPVRPSTALQA